jgi:triacylglycerol lipase
MGAGSHYGSEPDPGRGQAGFFRRGRQTVLAIGPALAVAASAVAVAACAGPGGPPGTANRLDPGRTAARDSPDARSGAGASPPTHRPAQGRLGPVLLIPGYGGETGSLQALADRIRASGRTATVLQLPGTGTGSLVADAAVLNAAVSRDLQGGAPSVDVVGYSAGGVVALLWAKRDGGAAKARRVITLGAPFHGSQLAAAAVAFAPGECPAACRQLVPGSKLLASLNAGASAVLPRWLSLWTADDAVVQPPDSARLAGAVNVPLQSLCRAARISHSQLPTSPVVTAIVLQELGPGLLHRPSAADCS